MSGNAILKVLRSGKSASCVWLALGLPSLAEFACEAGADAVVLDLQHGLWQRRDIEAAIGLIRPYAVPLVRVSDNLPRAIGEMLDAGAMGVIVPGVETAEEAAAAVAATRYPPLGFRSGGGIRPLADYPAYVAASRDNIMVAVMVETARGLANVDEIAAVEGVDMIFIGPGDLALSMEEFPVPGKRFEEAIQSILAACQKAGTPCGIFTLSSEAAASRMAEGFQFVTACDDISINRAAIRSAVGNLTTKSQSDS